MDPTLYREVTTHDTLKQEKLAFPVDDPATPPLRNVTTWTPNEGPSAGIVLISHGLHEHGLRYSHVAHSFTKRGFVVYAIDHYAHGQSDGKRALITDYKILPKDLVHLASIARSAHPNLPLSIVASSMGTLVAVLALTSIPDVKCIVLTGTAIFQGVASASPFGIKFLYPISQMAIAKTLAGILASIVPDGDAAPLLDEALTSDGAVVEIIKRDPDFFRGNTKNKTAFEFLKLVDAVKLAVPLLTVPFLALHGEDDEICLPTSARYLMEHSGTPAHLKECSIIPTLKHELFFESDVEATRIISTTVKYIENHSKVSVVSATIPETSVGILPAIVEDITAIISSSLIDVTLNDQTKEKDEPETMVHNDVNTMGSLAVSAENAPGSDDSVMEGKLLVTETVDENITAPVDNVADKSVDAVVDAVDSSSEAAKSGIDDGAEKKKVGVVDGEEVAV